MASFDYDVLIIGSGFGGSVAALRAAEKGYRVGVMESGRRWKDEDIPKNQGNLPGFLWFPAAERHWSERTVIMMCSQTTDTSIELYWDEGRLRSRHGADGSIRIRA